LKSSSVLPSFIWTKKICC